MPNKNLAFGARAFNTIISSPYEIRVSKYIVPQTEINDIGVNDFVRLSGESDENGVPYIAKATNTDKLIGFVVSIEQFPNNLPSYREGGTRRIIYVCDDPFIKFEMQVYGEFTENDVGKYANLLVGSVNKITSLSTTQLDGSTISTNSAQIKILRLVERQQNELGQYAKVECIINDHVYNEAQLWDIVGGVLIPKDSGVPVSVASFSSGDPVSLGGIDLKDVSNQAYNTENKTIVGSFNTALTRTHSVGIISGGEIKQSGPPTSLLVDGGTCYLRESDSDDAELKFYNFTGQLIHSIPLGEARYYYVKRTGPGVAAVYREVSERLANNHTEFYLGSAVNDSGTLHILNSPWRALDINSYVNERFYETKPFERADRIGGITIGETGTRNVTLSSGELYDILSEYTINSIDTSVSGTFDSYIGATQHASAQTQWDNQNYNNGGVLTPLTTNWYANLWWFVETDNHLVMVYGTAQYATSTGAEAEGIPAILPLRLQTHGRIVGRFIFRKGAATATLIESAFSADFRGTTANNHANLSNLTYNVAGHGTGYNGFLRGATVSSVDPTTSDDLSADYVEGDLWVNTSSDSSFTLLDPTASSAIWRKTYVAQVQKIYVGKHGNNGYDGKSKENAYNTIGAAINAVSPTAGTPVAIEVTDGAKYIENITGKSYLTINLGNAILEGQVTTTDNFTLIGNRIDVTSGAAILPPASSAGSAIVAVHKIVASGNTDGVLNNNTSTFKLHLDIDEIDCSGSLARGVNSSSSTVGAISGRVGIIKLKSSSTLGVKNTGSGTIELSGNSIIDEGAATTVGVDVDAGKVSLKYNSINADTAYDISGGALIFNGNSISGTETITGGTRHIKVTDKMNGLKHGMIGRQFVESLTYQASTNIVIANDDSKPQSSEGVQILATSYITSPNVTNCKIRLKFDAPLASSANSWLVASIYKGSDSDPLASATVYQASGTGMVIVSRDTEVTLNGNTLYNFYIRAGHEDVGNIYVNGSTAGRLYGGALGLTLLIEEFEA